MSLPKYPAYKDSGVSWLGEVPAHWMVAPLKRGYDVCLGKMLQTEPLSESDVLKPYLRAANIQWSGIDLSDVKSMWFSVRDCINLKLTVGDLLVSEGGDVGRSAIWSDSGVECYIQNSVNRVRASAGNSTSFLFYWMSTVKEKGYVDVLCNKSTIAHFTAEKVSALPVPYPPESEQNAIAAFLDRETAKIDALIAEQEKLIALLAEKRQATISRAVTRGLDPSVPLKDAGVPWLGKVPAHWERVSLGRLCNKISDGPHFSPNYVDEGVLFLSARNIKLNGFSLEDAKFISEQDYHEFCKRIVPEQGDVLYTKGGTTGVAKVVDLNERFQVWVHVAVLKLNKNIVLPRFLEFSLNSLGCYEQSQLYTRGATNQDLGLTRMVKILLALPPLLEQQAITDFLICEVGKIDTQGSDAIRLIGLLKERRAALISAAVTGKIDVRGLAA